jgi:hypothetical protein
MLQPNLSSSFVMELIVVLYNTFGVAVVQLGSVCTCACGGEGGGGGGGGPNKPNVKKPNNHNWTLSGWSPLFYLAKLCRVNMMVKRRGESTSKPCWMGTIPCN